MTGRHLGIDELGDVCRAMADRADRWFERLGGWVTDEPDPTAQRLFADACHRHAWHADLWRRRTPTIHAAPHDDVSAAPFPDVGRVEAYQQELRATRRRLASLRLRIDPELDPSTVRVITLVDADLADLERRLGMVVMHARSSSDR